MCTRANLNRPRIRMLLILVLGQNPWQFRPKWQGGGDITAYMYVVGTHALDGAPTVGAARIGRGVMLEGSVAT